MNAHQRITCMLLVAALICSAAYGTTTTTTKPKMEQVKDSWNNVLCTILKVVEYAAIGLAVLIIMGAGLRYMSADDAEARQTSKRMIVQVFVGIVIIFSAVQLVNYLVTGSKIERFDIEACDISFGNGTSGTTTTTTSAGGTTVTSASTSLATTTSTTSATATTSCLSPDDATATHQIRACEMAQEFRYLEPGEDMCDVITVVPAECCCSQLGKCCPE